MEPGAVIRNSFDGRLVDDSSRRYCLSVELRTPAPANLSRVAGRMAPFN